MLQALTRKIDKLKTTKLEGVAQRLWVVPITGPSDAEPGYSLLDAKALEKVQITEVSEGGQVPNLLVGKDLDTSLLLLDGQGLVGAKQNRILNTDVLVPARHELTIPVSCVESGRWKYRSRGFSPGSSSSYYMRAAKVARVHQSLKSSHGYDADQRAVWNEVKRSLLDSKSSSASSALHDAYSQHAETLSQARSPLKLPDDAVGFAVFHRREFLGLDLFDRCATMRYYWETLLDSYLIDLLYVVDASTDEDAPQASDAAAIMAEVANETWEPFKSPGEGHDYRLETKQYAGSALVWDERVVLHLQLFPQGVKR